MGIFSFMAFGAAGSFLIMRALNIAQKAVKEPEKAKKKEIKKAGKFFVIGSILFVVGFVSLK